MNEETKKFVNMMLDMMVEMEICNGSDDVADSLTEVRMKFMDGFYDTDEGKNVPDHNEAEALGEAVWDVFYQEMRRLHGLDAD